MILDHEQVHRAAANGGDVSSRAARGFVWDRETKSLHWNRSEPALPDGAVRNKLNEADDIF
jgi:hypothetical protein